VKKLNKIRQENKEKRERLLLGLTRIVARVRKIILFFDAKIRKELFPG
jgi:hypothetical protein